MINAKKIISFLSNNEKFKAKEIATALGLSIPTVKNTLYKLVSEEIVSCEGQIKSKKYFINKNK